MGHSTHHDDTLTTEDLVRLEAIASRMVAAGLPPQFVEQALEAAESPQLGLIDAFFDWDTASDAQERDEIIADIQGALFRDPDDPVVHALLADPDSVSVRVGELKHRLRPMVERQGGIESLSKRTGIPAAWLNRFFNSPAVPPQAALKKLQAALGLDDADVAVDLPPG